MLQEAFFLLGDTALEGKIPLVAVLLLPCLAESVPCGCDAHPGVNLGEQRACSAWPSSRENVGTNPKGSEEAVSGSHTSLGEALCADQAQRRNFLSPFGRGKGLGLKAGPATSCKE